MGKIRFLQTDQDRLYVVHCREPLQRMLPADPPYETTRLYASILVCEGASMWLVSDNHIAIPGDFGELEYWFGLEATRNNALALLAADVDWDESAATYTERFAIARSAVQELRSRIEPYLEEQRRAVMKLGPSASFFEQGGTANVFAMLGPCDWPPNPTLSAEESSRRDSLNCWIIEQIQDAGP